MAAIAILSFFYRHCSTIAALNEILFTSIEHKTLVFSVSLPFFLYPLIDGCHRKLPEKVKRKFIKLSNWIPIKKKAGKQRMFSIS